MDQQSANSIHAIVTDPPYGLKEYSAPEKQKLRRGKGGVWRIPPSFDGCVRSPLPRFTVLTDDELSKLRHFFSDFAWRAFRIMVPGPMFSLRRTRCCLTLSMFRCWKRGLKRGAKLSG